MATPNRRRGKRRAKQSKWDVDLASLENTLRTMDPSSREYVGTADIFMAVRWKTVQAMQEADDNSDNLVDLGEWIGFWTSPSRGEHQIMSAQVAEQIFGALVDKKGRGRVTMSEIVKFGKLCQRHWRETSSRGLQSALKKYTWFKAVVRKVEPEPSVRRQLSAAEEKDLVKENEELHELVDELEETVEDLRVQIDRSEEHATEILSDVDKAKAETAEKDQKIAEQKEEIDRLVNEMCQSQAAFDDELKRTREHIEQEASAHRAQREEAEQKIAELNRKLAEALEGGKIPDEFCNIPGHTDGLRELELLKADLDTAAKMIAELEQEQGNNLNRIKELEAACEAKDKRIEDLEERLRQDEGKIAQLKADHAEQKRALNGRISELEPLASELQRARETIDENNELIEKLKAQLAQKDDQLQQTKQLADNLQESNDRLTEELTALKNELTEKTEEIQALSSSSGDQANQLETIIQRRDNEISKLTEELEMVKHQLQHAQDKSEELEREKNAEILAANAEIQNLRNALENQRTRQEGLEADLRLARERLAQEQEFSKERQEIIIKLERQVVQFRTEVTELRQQNIVLVAQFKESQQQGNVGDIQDFQNEIAFRDGRIAQLEKEVERNRGRMKRASLMIQNVHSAQAGREREEQLERLQQELNDAVEKAEKAERQAQQPLRQNQLLWKQLGVKQKKIEILNKRVEDLEKMLELSEQRRDAMDDAFNNQMREVRRNLSLTRDESHGRAVAMEAELKSLRKQRQTLTTEKEDLHSYYELKVAEILEKLAKQKEWCAHNHGVKFESRVSQVRTTDRASKESVITTSTLEETKEYSEPSGPQQEVTLSDVDENPKVNLTVVELERVLLAGNYKVGLPSEMFCCGVLCCGWDWYCCSRRNSSAKLQPSSKQQAGR